MGAVGVARSNGGAFGRRSVTSHRSMEPDIQWPDGYRPDQTRVRVRNALEMLGVTASVVWAWLVRAELWPSWYSNSENVTIHGGGPDLRAGSTFHWKTFHVALESQVVEFTPYERLAWTGRGFGIDVCHAWLIQERSSGCAVLTEEHQNGAAAWLSHLLRPRNMSRYHQMWLEALFTRARSGPPPTPA